MKTLVVLAVSIVLVGILFCPMVLVAFPMPDDLQIVQPDPSLPKEISAFFGKWQGADSLVQHFLIVEKIDKEKASLYCWNSEYHGVSGGWERCEANVIQERGKYKVWYSGRWGIHELTLRGEYLDLKTGSQTISPRLKRVP